MLTPSTTKTCDICRKDFVPSNSMQRVCGIRCARRVPVQARNTLKRERKETKARLEALKPASHWVRLAQQAFNAWIRARDEGKPCISCGRLHGGKINAGHYLSTGARPELRFNEQNVHLQCEPCNTHLAGNLVLYRVNLIQRIGLEAVEALEGPHPPLKMTIDALKTLAADYRARTRALQRSA